ncbi:MAG TPA: glycosyltransferase family 1 protein [Gemmatimonadales bacterium]|nr:glycosyltransferase family 1 protein [Gemmatimonadales bacterium]
MPLTFLQRPPRVLYCTDTWAPQVNGVSVVTAISVRGLAERGWRSEVIAPTYPRAMYESGLEARGLEGRVTSLPSVPLPGYRDVRLVLPRYREVANVIDRFRPDLVHCQTEFMIGRLAQIAARRRGVEIVSTYHTDFGRYAVAYGAPYLRRPVTSYLARFHSRSRRVFTPSAAARAELRALGVRHASVWGRGVDDTRFNPALRHPEARERLGFGSRFTFLYVGRLAAEKNVEVVLEAYHRASAGVPRGVMRLVLAGTGPREAALRAAAREGVTFIGHLDRDRELPELYANADAFVFASTTETLGLVVLEAMASGLPVIAVPSGGVRDHLRHGVNGLEYPAGAVNALAAAMKHLASEPRHALELGRGARETAETLSWEPELDRLDAAYRSVLAGATAVMPIGHGHRRFVVPDAAAG